jgi:hypothetical protein
VEDQVHQDYYRKPEELHKALHERPNIYLTQAEMDRFVEGTTQQLYRIYRCLWEEAGETAGHTSTLELLLE